MSPARPGTISTLVWLRQEKIEEAIAAFREAIRLKPEWAEAHFNLGRIVKEAGKDDEAEAEFAEAKRLKPDIDDD